MKTKRRKTKEPPNLKEQEHLFDFLCSLVQGHARAEHPLLLQTESLHSICASPHPLLTEALGRCLDDFLIRVTPDTGSWGRFSLPWAVWGLAIAANNCLIPLPSPKESDKPAPQPKDETAAQTVSQAKNGPAIRFTRTTDNPQQTTDNPQQTTNTPQQTTNNPQQTTDNPQQTPDIVGDFTHALIDTLPRARTLHEILTYHALLDVPARVLPDLPPERSGLMHRLINLSPMTALCHLHLHTPPALTPLAGELLPGRKECVTDPSPWTGTEDWLDTLLPLTERPPIARFLRQRWLTLPETGPSCRNLGLVLEGLRRHGNHRDFILEFYEAYDYFRGQKQENIRGGTYRGWPILDKIGRLLRLGGESEAASEAAMRLNHRGSEYFLKFHALTQIIREERGVPRDYRHLNPGWIPALRPLLDFTEWERSGPEMGPVEFMGRSE